MRDISISNIAWDISDDDRVGRALLDLGVSRIDIAPGKYFADFSRASESEIQSVRQKWADRGFSIIGLQSLLYGTKGLNLFGKETTQKTMLLYLQHACRIGAILGATKLVFGSPKNRDKDGLSDEKADAIAYDFFNHLGNIAQREGVIICLEPNPSCYGANFLTTSLSTFNFVNQLNHPAIKMQLDTGSIFINRESFDLIPKIRTMIGHIHISEPNLSVLGTEKVDHAGLSATLRSISDLPRTIEMLNKDGRIANIISAVNLAKTFYQ